MEMLIAFVLAGVFLAAVVWWWERGRGVEITTGNIGETCDNCGRRGYMVGVVESTVTLAPGVADQPRGEQ
ncbi:MAG: hypothetical protein ACYTAN_18880 [Planctomycetota bacterium]|jgi:hypothetical protein